MDTKKFYKTTLPSQPLVTVVTVVFNGEQFIEETIQSVINQAYGNIEYIIIDGGSSDGTLDIIRKYEHAIDYWISEKDKGIYDAMNKGICLATGRWINFMNAGDIFFSSDTVSKIFSSEIIDEKIIYGDVHIKYLDFSRIERGGDPCKLWKGMQFCHQSAFINSSYHKLNEFNIANKIAADLEFFYGAFIAKENFKYIEQVISSVRVGGVSESNRLQTILASRDAVRNKGATWVVGICYIYFIMDALLRLFLKKILPTSVVKQIILHK